MARLGLRPGLIYDRYGEMLRLDRIAGWRTPDPTPVNEDYEPASITGVVPEISFLVGGDHCGLLLVDGPRIRRLFQGRDFFGISTYQGRWYAFHRWAGNGCIISFRIEDGRAVDARTELAGLSRGIHQIDFIDGSLWIVDTYQDRVLVVPVTAIGRGWRRSAKKRYPVGRSGIGRERPNHAHFNSLYGLAGGVYLVAHNETAKTCRGSELFLLDLDGRVISREPMGGSCCHNIGILDDGQVHCRSVEGTVARDGRDVLSLDAFVRGLSLGLDYHIVGTSTVEADRAKRNGGQGTVVITDTGFEPVATIALAGTQVFEVRRVDAPDLGISSTPRPDLEGVAEISSAGSRAAL